MFDGAANISITPGNDHCKRQAECVVSHLSRFPFKQVIKNRTHSRSTQKINNFAIRD